MNTTVARIVTSRYVQLIGIRPLNVAKRFQEVAVVKDSHDELITECSTKQQTSVSTVADQTQLWKHLARVVDRIFLIMHFVTIIAVLFHVASKNVFDN